VKEDLDAQRSDRGPILIVDDEVDTRTLLTEAIQAEGFEVVAAGDGAEALEYLRSAAEVPCLILLDLVMPNMDGWQFIEERRHDRRLAGIPVVLISGQVSARETARSSGLASFIEKPIALASVRDVLTRVRDHTLTAA
jgi:CheY-like chemotaxis protein